jgi:ribosomal protein S18 acetylase RimI-like enzyme
MYVKGSTNNFCVQFEVSIRKCEASDLPMMEWEGAFTLHREIIRETFERQLRGEVLMLVAEANGFPIGQVWIDFLKAQQSNAGYLWALRVIAPFRRRGIGRVLIESAEQILKESGIVFARLAVERDNTLAMALYQRLGYQNVGTHDEKIRFKAPDGQWHTQISHEFLMEKALILPSNSHKSRTARNKASEKNANSVLLKGSEEAVVAA